MRHPPDTLSRAVASQSESARPGLFRQEVLGTERALTVTNLFSDLRRLNRGEIIAVHRERHLQGTRLVVDPSHGHGFWELYRLDRDLYVVAVDGVYDTGRVETVPGEGLVEFCIRLSGVLELSIPGCAGTVRVAGPQLLVWYQPPDVTVTESLRPKMRESCICLYCKPAFLRGLVERSGISQWPLLEQIHNHRGSTPFFRLLDLSPTLLYVAKSLLECPYRRAIRLLHAEAKALELLCEGTHAGAGTTRYDCMVSCFCGRIPSSRCGPAPIEDAAQRTAAITGYWSSRRYERIQTQADVQVALRRNRIRLRPGMPHASCTGASARTADVGGRGRLRSWI